jgi:hypothetical protein
MLYTQNSEVGWEARKHQPTDDRLDARTAEGGAPRPVEVLLIRALPDSNVDDDSIFENISSELCDELDWSLLAPRVTTFIVRNPPIGGSTTAAQQVRRIFRSLFSRAALRKSDFLIVFGQVRLHAEQVFQLQRTISADPLSGFAVPRLALAGGTRILAIESDYVAEPRSFGRAELPRLNPTYLSSELQLSPITLVRSDVVANLEFNVDAASTFQGALLEHWIQARRVGFSTIIDNRCVIECGDTDFNFRIEAGELERIETRYPCHKLAGSFLAKQPELRHEHILASRKRPSVKREKPRVLLDSRNVMPIHNGTAKAALGVFRGLSTVSDQPCDLTVLVESQSEAFFQMRSRFPNLRFISEQDREAHDCVIRLAQTWDIPTWRDLHSWGLVIATAILDSIAVDTVYNSNEAQRDAFQFGADFADGLLFNSDYTRTLFNRRFDVDRSVFQCTYHHSFSLPEYRHGNRRSHERRGIFIVGNEYDHKHLMPTIEVIASAFPFIPIRALGASKSQFGNVTALPSGSLSDDEVQLLYNTASVVVFPSFYEGFGLPILEGLAAGAPVVARASPLLDEIAAHLAPGPTLASFSDVPDLVATLGRILQGDRPTGVPLGARVNGEVLNWTGVAARVVNFAVSLLEERSPGKWRRRDRALKLAGII